MYHMEKKMDLERLHYRKHILDLENQLQAVGVPPGMVGMAPSMVRVTPSMVGVIPRMVGVIPSMVGVIPSMVTELL